MKTLFSTLLLAFAVVMVSCGSKTTKATEETAAPATEVVVEETATPAATTEEAPAVEEPAKKAE